MKKTYILFLFLMLGLIARAQNTYTISSGTNLVPSGGVNLVFGAGTLTNNTAYTDTEGSVAFVGGVTYAGSGTMTLNSLVVNHNAATSELNSPIDITGKLTATAGTLNANGNLTLKSTAAKTAVVAPVGIAATVSGNVTAERYIPAKRAYRFVSSPVTTTTSIYENWQENGGTTAGLGTHITGATGAIGGFDVTVSNSPSLFTFDNATANWNAVTNTNVNALSAGVPYRLMVRGDRTISMATNTPTPTTTTLRSIGTLFTGSKLVDGLNEAADAYNFIGNPYQAPVDMEAVLASAVNLNTNFYYVWDPKMSTRGAYVTGILANGTNTISGSLVNNYLQPGQACFVKTSSAGTASLTFEESHKYTTTTNEGVFRIATSNPSNIRLTLYDSNALRANEAALDGLLVFFGANYTNAVDGSDAGKFTNLDETFSTTNNGKSLSVESRTTAVDTDIIPLKIAQYRGTNYTIVAKGTNLDGATAYLYDKHLDTYTPIPSSGTVNYAYTIDAGDAATSASDRFSVTFTNKSLGIGNVIKADFAIYPNPSKGGRFNVLMPNVSNNAKLSIYNIIGQQVYTTALKSGTPNQINPNKSLAPGTYVVKITDGGKTISDKLIIE
jgi:hypothetical protein